MQTGSCAALPRRDLARRSSSQDEHQDQIRTMNRDQFPIDPLMSHRSRKHGGLESTPRASMSAPPSPKREGERRPTTRSGTKSHQGKHHSRIPKSLLSLVRLPPTHDRLELRQSPRLFHEGRLRRGIQIHQLKVKDHIEFLVLWKDVRRERRGVVCEGRLAYCDQVMACGDHSRWSVNRCGVNGNQHSTQRV